MTTYEKIKELCEKEGFAISNIGEHISGISATKSTVSFWKNGMKPRPMTIRLIAEHFGKPVSYFLDDQTDDSVTHVTLSGTVNGDVNGNGNAIGGIVVGSSLSEQEDELVTIFRSLSVKGKARALVALMEIEEDEKNKKSTQN